MSLKILQFPRDYLQLCTVLDYEGCELLKPRSISEGASTILGELRYGIKFNGRG